MSLGSLYKPGNKQADYSDVYCHSVNTKGLSFNETDYLTSLDPDYLRVTKLAYQAVPSGVPTNIINYDSSFGSLEFDFDIPTGVWTVAKDGYYSITASLSIDGSAPGGYRQFQTNFSTKDNYYILSTQPIGNGDNLVLSCNYYLQAGETLSLQLLHNQGGNVTILEARLNVFRINPLN